MIFGLRYSTRLSLFLILAAAAGAAAQTTRQNPPIDLDRALQANLPQDRAQAYYYYSLAKWYEGNDDIDRALTHLRTAARHDQTSSTLRLELASLLWKAGSAQESVQTAQEAASLDPANPEPHWFLANAYLRTESRSRPPTEEANQKALQELEAMREIAPDDERSYYTLGEIYFRLNQPEKAIEAYEKFQSLVPNVDAGYMAIAGYYERQGNEQKKVEYLQKAVDRSPDSAQALVGLASAYARQNKDKEAIPLFKKALETSDGNPLIKKQLALSMVNAGEFAEAKEILAELARIDPRDLSTKVLIGRAWIGERRYKEAIETLRSVLAEDSAYLEAEFYLGAAYELSGDMVEAVRVFEDLVSKAKDGSDDYKANLPLFQQRLASSYQQMGDNERAIAIYESMIQGKQDPDPRVMFNLINALRISRQFDRALALCKEQSEKNEDDTGIALVHARTLADAGKVQEGADLLLKLLPRDPSNTDLYINLSQVYLQGGRYAEAEQILKRAEASDQDHQRVQVQLAAVFEKREDYDRAEAVLRDLIEKNPKDAMVLNFYGYMLADRGVRLPEAVRYIEEALALEPNNGAYLDSLGWAYFKMGQLDPAEEYLLRAIERSRNDPEILDHLGDLYARKGDPAKAQEYWEKSLRHGTEEELIRKVREKLKKSRKPIQ
ncbi:MAG: tetratricopeptide repeat protein [Acidobacteriota bacterium]